jgi:hypothetical protein
LSPANFFGTFLSRQKARLKFLFLIRRPGATKFETRVFKNTQKPPRTDQFNLVVRQKLADWQTSLTYSRIRGQNYIIYYHANRSLNLNARSKHIEVRPGFVIASDDTRQTRFAAVYSPSKKLPYCSGEITCVLLNDINGE